MKKRKTMHSSVARWTSLLNIHELFTDNVLLYLPLNEILQIRKVSRSFGYLGSAKNNALWQNLIYRERRFTKDDFEWIKPIIKFDSDPKKFYYSAYVYMYERSKIAHNSLTQFNFLLRSIQKFGLGLHNIVNSQENRTRVSRLIQGFRKRDLGLQEGQYYGYTYNRQPHGKGKIISDAGLYYGDWEFGSRSGKGSQRNEESYYIGDWLNNKFHGYGTYWNYRKKTRYVGFFKRGYKSGYGLLMSSRSGRIIYKGNWFNSKKHGPGIHYRKNGITFHGTWINGTLEGKFIRKDNNGNWTGDFEFKGGVCHGPCHYIKKDGGEFTGTFKNGKRHGPGILKHKLHPFVPPINGFWIRGHIISGTTFVNMPLIPSDDEDDDYIAPPDTLREIQTFQEFVEQTRQREERERKEREYILIE